MLRIRSVAADVFFMIGVGKNRRDTTGKKAPGRCPSARFLFCGFPPITLRTPPMPGSRAGCEGSRAVLYGDDEVVEGPGILHRLNPETGRFNQVPRLFNRKPFFRRRADIHRLVFPVKVDKPPGRFEHPCCVRQYLDRVQKIRGRARSKK